MTVIPRKGRGRPWLVKVFAQGPYISWEGIYDYDYDSNIPYRQGLQLSIKGSAINVLMRWEGSITMAVTHTDR